MTYKKYEIDSQALTQVFNRARQLIEEHVQPLEGNFPKITDDPHLARTLCYMQATLELLKAQEVFPYDIEIKKKVEILPEIKKTDFFNE
ncbi:unnamed protein product [marine sediment metagenome]|uniref:Uncharacterized protein n=1 Tax=marine sediment metagenome TaxID=412755 RepID=X0TTT8_9ZZZZ